MSLAIIAALPFVGAVLPGLAIGYGRNACALATGAVTALCMVVLAPMLPAVMAGEVAGSVSERELLSAVFEGRAKLADAVALHMSPPLPLIGAGELVSVAAKALRDADAVMVVEGGKPVGVITRHDLLGFLSEGSRRR